MKNTTLALGLILLAAFWRILSAFEPSLSNVAPITALAFCGAAYLRDWRWWLVPFLALMLSDLWLNYYHATQFGFTWSFGEILLRLLCFAAAVGVGRLVARRRNGLTLLGGALTSSLIFYLGTNTVAWAGVSVHPLVFPQHAAGGSALHRDFRLGDQTGLRPQRHRRRLPPLLITPRECYANHYPFVLTMRFRWCG
jgi:hypothetical protein